MWYYRLFGALDRHTKNASVQIWHSLENWRRARWGWQKRVTHEFCSLLTFPIGWQHPSRSSIGRRRSASHFEVTALLTLAKNLYVCLLMACFFSSARSLHYSLPGLFWHTFQCVRLSISAAANVKETAFWQKRGKSLLKREGSCSISFVKAVVTLQVLYKSK